MGSVHHHRRHRRWFRRLNVRLLVILAGVALLVGVGLVGGHYVRKRIVAQRELAAGLAAVQREDWPSACDHLLGYLSRYPDDVEILEKYAKARLAIRPLREQNVGAAIGAYRQLLRNKPGDAAVCEELAKLYFSVGNYVEADYVARQRLEADRDDVRAAVWRGRSLVAQRKFDQAIEVMSQFVEAHPDQIEVYALLSAASLRDGSEKCVEESLKWLDRAVERLPQSADARARRARFHWAVRKDAARARADLNAADELPTEDPRVLLALVQAWLDLGESKRAEARLAALKKLDDKVLDASEITREDLAFLSLKAEADLAWQRNAAKEGVAVADRAMATLKDERRTLFLPYAIELYLADNQVDRAQQCLDRFRADLAGAAAGDPNRRDAAQQEQLALMEAVLANARENFYAAINRLAPLAAAPRNPHLWRVLAFAYERTGQPRLAIGALEKYTSHRPGDRRALMTLARLCLANGLATRAQRIAQDLERADPADIEAKLARISATIEGAGSLSETERAALLRELDDLAKANPRNGQIRLQQAALTAAAGRLEETAAILADAARNTDRPLPATIQLAGVLAEMGQADQAIAVCRSLIEAQPAAASPRILLARIEARAGRVAEAGQTLEQAVATTAGEERIAATNALVGFLAVNGRRPEAIAILKKECDLRPNDPRPRLALLNMPEVQNDAPFAQQLIEQTQRIEGEHGLRWQVEQARLWRRSDQWKERQEQIRAFLERGIEGDPAWSLPVLVLGDLYEALGKIDQAERVYRRFVDACAGQPGHVAVAARLLELLERQRRFTESARILERLPGSPGVLSRHRATLALARGELDAAVDELKEQIAASPNDLASRVVLARLTYARHKDARAALELLDDVLKRAPEALSAVSTKAIILQAEGRKDEALALVNAEVERRQDFGAYLLRGEYYALTGRLDLAEKDFERLTTFADLVEQGYAQLGVFHQRCGRPDKALAAWQAGLAAKPDSVELQRLLIRGLVTSSQPARQQEGRAKLDEFLKRAPNDADLLSLRAAMLLGEGRPEAVPEALAAYERVIEINPRDVAAHLMLIRHAAAEGNLSRANDLAKRALRQNPDDPDLLLIRAEIENDLGNRPAAQELIQAVLAIHPKSLPARGLQFRMAMRAGRLDEAEAIAADALKIAPDSEDALLWHCQVLRGRNRPQQAIEKLEAARQGEAGRGRLRTLLALVELYQASNNPTAAEARLQEAEKLAPDSPDVFLARMQWIAGAKRYDDLVVAVVERRRKYPDDPRILLAAAQLLAAGGAEQYMREAVPLYERVAALNPSRVEAIWGVAAGAHVLGDLDKAEKNYRRLLELAPNHQDALNNLAWILCEDRKKPQEALELARRGVSAYPNDPHLLNTRGVIYFRLNSLAEAKSDLEKCLELSADLPSTRAKTLLYLGRIHSRLGETALAHAKLDQALVIDRQNKVLTDDERAEAEKMLKTATP